MMTLYERISQANKDIDIVFDTEDDFEKKVAQALTAVFNDALLVVEMKYGICCSGMLGHGGTGGDASELLMISVARSASEKRIPTMGLKRNMGLPSFKIMINDGVQSF